MPSLVKLNDCIEQSKDVYWEIEIKYLFYDTEDLAQKNGEQVLDIKINDIFRPFHIFQTINKTVLINNRWSAVFTFVVIRETFITKYCAISICIT